MSQVMDAHLFHARLWPFCIYGDVQTAYRSGELGVSGAAGATFEIFCCGTGPGLLL